MTRDPFHILVLCTGNSARSILGEVLLNEHGAGRVRAFSAGSHPKGQVHPGALDVLSGHGHATDGLSSKSWDVFAVDGAPKLDLVVTVCDNAAGEVCPVWHGTPVKAHWGIPDPAAVTGPPAAVAAAFETAYTQMRERVQAFCDLDFEAMPKHDLKAALDRIGDLP